jgi:hypothetical protein
VQLAQCGLLVLLLLSVLLQALVLLLVLLLLLLLCQPAVWRSADTACSNHPGPAARHKQPKRRQ